ncbi:hypothetical protein [Bradyrhizobium barranii]
MHLPLRHAIGLTATLTGADLRIGLRQFRVEMKNVDGDGPSRRVFRFAGIEHAGQHLWLDATRTGSPDDVEQVGEHRRQGDAVPDQQALPAARADSVIQS